MIIRTHDMALAVSRVYLRLDRYIDECDRMFLSAPTQQDRENLLLWRSQFARRKSQANTSIRRWQGEEQENPF